MADSLNDLHLFTAIVNAGAITRAAMALNSSPPPSAGVWQLLKNVWGFV